MEAIDDLTIAVRRRRRDLDEKAGEARSVLLRGQEVKKEIASLTEEVTVLERVTALLNSIGEEKQLAAQNRIEELVTRGLQTIFDETLSFHIIQTVKGRTASVEFLIRKTLNDTVLETPVLEAQGGGLSATVGFLLRVVVMLLGSGTKEENILVLDETFAHVSAEYIGPLGEFLREIVDKTGVQIVMVTHQPEFADYADKVYRFSQTDGKTNVSESGA